MSAVMIRLGIALSGALGKLWAGAAATLSCAGRNPGWALCVVLAGLSLWFWRGEGQARADADRWQAQAMVESTARIATIANYRTAQKVADQMQAANIARATREQKSIDERKTHDLAQKLAANAAHFERVRRELAARTDLGSTDAVPMSIASQATCIAYGAADCDGLLAKLKAAQDQTDRLIALQGWAAEQGAVRVNPSVEEPAQ